MRGFSQAPDAQSYDVVIVGGAMMGSAAAFYLSRHPGFDGSILVVEADPTYARAATALTNSCIRQQFSTALNVQISQYTAEVIRTFRELIGDERVPDLSIQSFGYLYLAGDAAMEARLRADREVQARAGAATRLLTPEDIAAAYPVYDLSDIRLGSLNTVDEGYWDGGTVFDWFRRASLAAGVTYVADRVTGIDRQGARVLGVTLAGAGRIVCGTVIDAAGTRAAQVAEMAGLSLPVEPRKRMTWIVRPPEPLPVTLPLTIDPSGVHVRQEGPETYMVGAAGWTDPAVAPDDFAPIDTLWEERVWPILAARIPAFERLRVQAEWAGHYDYNIVDQNAVLGPHPEVGNFLFCAGFSGHGLQQAPAMGRGLAEWIATGDYRSLDLSPFGYARLAREGFAREHAVI